MSPVRAGSVSIGAGCPLALLAGPCVIESTDHCLRMADALRRVAEHLGMPFVFKASYDKANRTSVDAVGQLVTYTFVVSNAGNVP